MRAALLLLLAACPGELADVARAGPGELRLEPEVPEPVTLVPAPPSLRVSVTPPRTMDFALPIDEAMAFGAGLALVTWPDLQPVPAQIELTRDASFDTWAVVPLQPLDERWYAIRIAALPPDLAPVETSFTRDAGGLLLVRFRLDSFPVLGSVVLCEQQGGIVILPVFSEPVAPVAGLEPPFSVVQDEEPVACAVDPALALLCDSVRPDLPLVLRIGTGLESTEGAQVPGYEVSVPPRSSEEPCWIHKVP